MTATKLNDVAVDNTPEPKSEREEPGCITAMIPYLLAMTAAVWTCNMAEMYDVKLPFPKAATWTEEIIEIVVFVFLAMLFCEIFTLLFQRVVPGSWNEKRKKLFTDQDIKGAVASFVVCLWAALPRVG